jgi:DHA1 family bicyclomycin/chloramphenicol resistance-like MFS transporter
MTSVVTDRPGRAGRIRPDSPAFTVLLGMLASLPTFGIDMILPSLSTTAIAVRTSSSAIGQAMSIYLLSFGVALVINGPLSDRFGRRPVALGGCALLAVASIGCATAQSLPALLVWRALQGAGASGPGMTAFTLIRDMFEGEAARAKIAYVISIINIVPMVAPTVGATLLQLGGWRSIYLVPMVGAVFLLLALTRIAESAPADAASRLRPSTVVRDYFRVLAQPVCLGNILCNAGGAGAVFAYITGSALVLINVLGLSPAHYGLVFGASSVSVMVGTHVNLRLGAWGVSPSRLIAAGLAITIVLAAFLLSTALLGWTTMAVVIVVMVGVALSFGLISPNAIHAAMQPLPQIAGAVSGTSGFMQMAAAASSSGLVAALFDGRSALSMGGVMLAFSLVAAGSYLWIARPAERLERTVLYTGVYS